MNLEKKPEETFKKIISFINKVINKDENIDIKRVKKIINSISFDKLKKQEEKNGFQKLLIMRIKK